MISSDLIKRINPGPAPNKISLIIKFDARLTYAFRNLIDLMKNSVIYCSICFDDIKNNCIRIISFTDSKTSIMLKAQIMITDKIILCEKIPNHKVNIFDFDIILSKMSKCDQICLIIMNNELFINNKYLESHIDVNEYSGAFDNPKDYMDSIGNTDEHLRSFNRLD